MNDRPEVARAVRPNPIRQLKMKCRHISRRAKHYAIRKLGGVPAEQDGGLVRHAQKEMSILWPKTGDADNDSMQSLIMEDILDLVRVFSAQGHSGSTAPYCVHYFEKFAMFKTVAPLTGEDDEWRGDHMDGRTLQNKRNSAVFKDLETGEAYWIDGKIFRDPDGCTYTSRGSRVPVEFPWTQPESEIVDVDEDGEPILSADKETLKALCVFKMTNDHPEQSADMEKIDAHLDKLAVDAGFKNWLDAYHQL